MKIVKQINSVSKSINREKIQMEKPNIEFCMLNIGNHSNQVKERLVMDPNINISTYGCLKRCSTCFKKQYALVDGEIVTGDTPEQLVDNVYQHIGPIPAR